MSQVLNKIKQFIDYKGISISQLEKMVGMSNGSFGSQLKNNKTIGHDKIENILKSFPELSSEWLFNDTGEMVKELPLNKKAIPLDNFLNYDNAEEIGELKGVEESPVLYHSGNQFIDIGNGKMQMLIPVVEQYAYAGYLSGYADVEFLDELPKLSIIVDKLHKGTYRGFNVRGDSMDDGSKNSISNGEIAVGRLIQKEYWKSKLHLYQWHTYAIVHQDGILLKRITHHDVENGIITAISLNPDKVLYPDLQIKLSEVYQLFNIVQIIKNFF